jgi:HlyD family secretion protein
VDETNTVHQTPVKLGQRTGDYVQLIDGPPAGSRVLAIGSAFTLDGDVIKPAEDAAPPAAPAAPGGQ